MEEDTLTIVMDSGSGNIRVGYDFEHGTPKSVLPTIIGNPKTHECMGGMQMKDEYLGNEAQKKRGLLNLRRPVSHGIVENWDDMETLWQYALYEDARVEPEEYPILMTEPPYNPTENREKMAQIMFETFNRPAMYVGIQAILPLYNSGRTTSVVVYSKSR